MKNQICAQHYYVGRLYLSGGRRLDFNGLNAQMFAIGRKGAAIVVVDETAKFPGLVRPDPKFTETSYGVERSYRVERIEYTVAACANGKIVSQDFAHKFKVKPVLVAPIYTYIMEVSQRDLFTTRLLSDILNADFGKLRGLQFCC